MTLVQTVLSWKNIMCGVWNKNRRYSGYEYVMLAIGQI